LGTADDDILPEGDFTERFEYDSNGRVIKQISFEGVIITFTYDDPGQVKSKQYFENQVKYFTDSPSQTWTYEYDSQGRVISVNQNGRITETTYDAQGRTTSITTPEGTVYYEYDKYGRQIRVSSNKGDDISYSYDLFGRLETVTNNANGDVTKYEYDLVGNLSRTITKTAQTTLITTYEYDNMNRLIKETNFIDKNNNQKFDSGEGISQFTYKLDKQGKKTEAVEEFWADLDEDGTLDFLANYVNWQYDNAGRLIKEVFDHYDDNFDQTSEWIYDLVGNRLKQTVNGKDTICDYDSNDRLLNEISGTKKTVYGYDHTQQTSKTITENGEIVSTTTFEYDQQGRMSVVTIVTGNRKEITKYEYGADGIRVSAEHEIYIDGQLQSKIRTEYLNDPKSLTGYSQVLRQTEYDADGNVIKTISYVIGHQRISQTIEIGGEKTTHYFTFDGHGSTRALLDLTGAIVQLYAFDAYGNALGFNTSEALTEFLYSGEQFDSKIGQQYLRQRYYDSTTGRFNRLDLFFGNVTDPLSLHNYLYAHTDPIMFTDPSGKIAWMPIIGLLAGMGIGAGVSALVAPSFGLRRVDGALIGGAIGSVAGSFVGLSAGSTILASTGVKTALLAIMNVTIGTGKLAYIEAAAIPLILGIAFDAYSKIWSNKTLRDPAPTNTLAEWSNKSILEHIRTMPVAHERDIAINSLEQLLCLADLQYKDPTFQLTNDTSYCHDFCYHILNEWLKTENESPTNKVVRRQFFTVSKTRYIRNDGYGNNNDHATIEIKFTDGRIAHIDDGWFGKLGPMELRGNYIFGNSNIPSNYSKDINYQDGYQNL
jgi:RHS repeat-associated protein